VVVVVEEGEVMSRISRAIDLTSSAGRNWPGFLSLFCEWWSSRGYVARGPEVRTYVV